MGDSFLHLSGSDNFSGGKPWLTAGSMGGSGDTGGAGSMDDAGEALECIWED